MDRSSLKEHETIAQIQSLCASSSADAVTLVLQQVKGSIERNWWHQFSYLILTCKNRTIFISKPEK